MHYNIFADGICGLWDDYKNLFPLTDKRSRVLDLTTYMFNRTSQIFKWTNTPKTIKPYILERFLQIYGNLCVTEVDPVNVDREKGLYIFFGGLGGEPDENYEPTLYTVANPFLKFNAELTIGRDCIRARNDTSGMGLLPLFMKYASMINENEISLNMTAINYRISNLISADDDRTYSSAKEYLDQIIAGKFGVISSQEFFEGLEVHNPNDTRKITDLIEYEQYLKASWYNEIGLNSNYNMKRERIVAAEAELTDDALIPLVENMLDNRKKMIEDVKELYGDRYDLDGWDVALNPLWDLDNMYMSIDKTTTPEDANDNNEMEDVENVDSGNIMSDSDGNDNSVDSIDENPTEEINETSEEDPATVEININIDTADNVEVTEDTEKEVEDDGNLDEKNDGTIE